MDKFKVECGWTVYQCSSDENALFGGFGICDDCGTFSKIGYLVPVLNHYMCSTCFLDWSKRCKFYSSDVDFERHYIRYYESIIPVDLDLSLICS